MKLLSTATFSLYLNSSSWEDLGSCHIFPMFVIELNRIGDCLMSRWLPLLRSSNMLSRRFWSFCRWSMPIIVVKKIFWKWRGRRGRREASNSSNSLVVVCSSLSIQNSIWRVSGLFKLNFWSVSCPNSSRQQQQTLFVLQEFKWEKIWTAAQQPYYKFSPLFRSCDLSYLAVVDIKRESSSSWYFSTHAISFHKCLSSKEHWGLDNSTAGKNTKIAGRCRGFSFCLWISALVWLFSYELPVVWAFSTQEKMLDDNLIKTDKLYPFSNLRVSHVLNPKKPFWNWVRGVQF